MPPRLFVELFRELVQGRERYLAQDGNNQNTSQIARAIDEFRGVARAYYCDAELILRLNAEPDIDVL
jgi:hypothetical protein